MPNYSSAKKITVDFKAIAAMVNSRRIREKMGLYELSTRTGYQVSHITRLMKGQRRMSLESLMVILNALGYGLYPRRIGKKKE
jgi:hypothetical protein